MRNQSIRGNLRGEVSPELISLLRKYKCCLHCLLTIATCDVCRSSTLSTRDFIRSLKSNLKEDMMKWQHRGVGNPDKIRVNRIAEYVRFYD
ncbi:L-lactate dehydrogenase [Dorcoceras hygrometricum]|uniref:L-lactate dehydrogenase n=1 Tax=Dorcoceras hygrometricum TaxID=472368 RepID=A0A2Z7CRU5_9LAMI|nr:L-lactate dehydrogenase [Dorcoceras hygrometricum]